MESERSHMAGEPKIRVFDLFCGGGGSSLGAKQAGAHPVGGVDSWSIATDAYSRNLPGATTYNEDLTELSPAAVSKRLGRIDLLLASPECTHHSVAKGNKPRSEESKQLAFQVVRFAKALKPRWLVVENVIQMRSWPSYSDWLQQIHEMGYNTIEPTLQAADFGVPQTRRRMFVIGDREAIPPMLCPYRKRDATAASVLCSTGDEEWSYRFTPLDNGRRAAKTLDREASNRGRRRKPRVHHGLLWLRWGGRLPDA